MLLVMLFLLGFIQYVSLIKCYTCNTAGHFCFLPLNIDAGDENNLDEITSSTYDSDYVCQSDHYINARTGLEKLILRGIKYCKELNVVNHRIHCCDTDNCNKRVPIMAIQTFIYSNNQRYLPSIILIVLSMFFQYVL